MLGIQTFGTRASWQAAKEPKEPPNPPPKPRPEPPRRQPERPSRDGWGQDSSDKVRKDSADHPGPRPPRDERD